MNKIEKCSLNAAIATIMTLSSASCAKAPEVAKATTSTCPTTAEAQKNFGVNVQRLDTEACAFVWRGKPESHSAICPKEYTCTWDVKNDVTVVHYGIDQNAEIYAGTWRLSSAYPEGDPVHDICQLYRQEKDFGQKEIPPFEVRFQAVPGIGPDSCPKK